MGIEAPFIVLTAEAVRMIRDSERTRGGLRLRLSGADQIYVVEQVETHADQFIGVRIPREFVALNWGDLRFPAQWFRAPDEALALHYIHMLRRPGAALSFDNFQKMLPGVEDPGGNLGLVIVHHRALSEELISFGAPEVSGWRVSREGVEPFDVRCEPHEYGAVQLVQQWPVRRLSRNTITIVGVGSIGSAAASALANLGIGRLNLVDPDRLLWHNLVRHRLGPESVGRFKVDALKTHLDGRASQFEPEFSTAVVAHRLDIVQHADRFRELAEESDVILCCADGIAPRRVANHIARIARKPAIFACVLDDGSIGEVFRSRPGRRYGCLLCHRAALDETGAMDPESDQELDYGTGLSHKPMTAIPSDLEFVAQLAVKVTMATLLEACHGDATQRIPGDHAVVGLRPTGGLLAPFDVHSAGEVRWRAVPAPRLDCATCSIA